MGSLAADVRERFDVEVLLTVDDVRGGRVEGGGGGWAEMALEVGDVDDGVTAAGGGEGELVGHVGADLKDGVGTVEFGAELSTSAGGGGRVEER